MAREKKPVHRVQMTEGKRNIIHQLLKEYDIQSAEDIQDALKDLLGGTIKEMMEAEMDDHLGYEKSQRSDSGDYRNGYKRKRVNSRYGSSFLSAHKEHILVLPVPPQHKAQSSEVPLLPSEYPRCFQVSCFQDEVLRLPLPLFSSYCLYHSGNSYPHP